MPNLRLRNLLAASLAAQASLLVGTPRAHAEDYVREGWYAGARGVYAVENFDVDGTVDNDFGFNLFAGYRMFRGLASDFEFEYIDAFPVRGDPAGPNYDVRTFDLAWNFRVYPLAWAFEPGSVFQRVQPYLSAGPSLQWAQLQRLPGGDRDEGNFAGRLGGGIDFLLTENVALTADAIYTIGTGDVSDFPYLSIGWGLLYRFGGGEASAGAEDEPEEDDEDAP
jgi:opacity protein-like surface antigen